MHSFITDHTFDLNRINEYHLSIQVSLDGFSFLITDSGGNKLMALKKIPATIGSEKFLPRRFADWIASETIFEKRFGSVNILYYTPKFSLIPSPWFEKKKQNTLSDLLFGHGNNAQIIHNSIEPAGAELIFSLPEALKAQFDQQFENHTLLHPATVLLQKNHPLFAPDKSGLTLFFAPDSFLLFLYKNGSLALANSYHFKHPNDVVYYILTALRHSGMAPKKCKLLLSGEIYPKEETEVLLKNYFNQIGFLIPEIQSDPEIFKDPLHPYIVLF